MQMTLLDPDDWLIVRVRATRAQRESDQRHKAPQPDDNVVFGSSSLRHPWKLASANPVRPLFSQSL
jgi:hypothetical protein